MDELKNKVYELEGLLELLSHRPDKQADLYPLIGKRVDEISRIWNELNSKELVQSKVSEESVQSEESEVSESSVISQSSQSSQSSHPSQYSQYSDSADFTETVSRKAPALCLNDRFRFTRVLAGNDRNRFDAILEKLSQLPDYEAARDYLIEECNADIDDPEVVDFLDILQNYYE